MKASRKEICSPSGYRIPTTLNVSNPAALALDAMKRYLKQHPAWLHAASSSVVLEFMAWHYFQSCSTGEFPKIQDFKPETKSQGRPPNPHNRMSTMDNARPANVRQKDSVADIWKRGKV